MNYIIISPNGSTSELRAFEINRELYKINRPTWDERDGTKWWLPMFVNGTSYAFGFDDNHWLPVSSQADVTVLKNLLSQDASQTERDALESYILSKIGDKIFFKDIIPSTIIIHTSIEGYEIVE